jgi:osmoprotectant transport system permease protein
VKLRPPDLPGVLFGTVALASLLFGTFVVEKANRIVPGIPLTLASVPTPGSVKLWMAPFLLALGYAALTRRPIVRFLAAFVALTALCATLGGLATALTPPDDRVLRIAPGVGFWLAAAAVLLLVVDAAAQARLAPLRRVALLFGVIGLGRLALHSGYFDQVSVLREYAVNADRFAHELERHLLLAVGSLAAAVVLALPAGVYCHSRMTIARALLSALSVVQTIPSIALYGILMAPLAALAAAMPTLAAIGVGGIGYAPALIALFLYALFPIVANTVLGLRRVDPQILEAAQGMGLTDAQILWRVRWPLALPTVLTGIRVVLVQNVGLAAVAALIGGGGLGTFIFQGIGQTAIDLVLLGALPTVALALVAGVLLDALVDGLQRRSVT